MVPELGAAGTGFELAIEVEEELVGCPFLFWSIFIFELDEIKLII